MLRCYLIRHSITEGNRWKRYVGTTDEALCQEGIDLLKNRTYPKAEILFTSPLKRCRETAESIYPGQKQIVIDRLRECDFGEFENKNYMELSDNLKYQEWIDSGGSLPFPQGESKEIFSLRSVDGFLEAVDICQKKNITCASFVVHGGTIMSIMERFAYPGQSYYYWTIDNGEGYELDFKGEIEKNHYRRLEWS